MGGKTGTTTSSVSIPPEVLARYNSVNAQAQTAAGTPFQQYSTDPNAFVAPLNAQQNAGINNINQQANAAQPGYQAAMAGTANAAQGFNAQNYQQGVQAYMNPYLQNAMGSTAAYLQNQNQQQQNQLQGNAISSGAFGGDRGNVAQAALMGQQNLAMGQTLGQMANQGYQQSAQNYMTGLQQQGALANQYGNLAGQAQQIGLAGAQAQLGAGTLGQQTTQAGNTALYNQFQQQQAYPFQVAQFLSNIAEGTGALSGSTTTQTSPTSFFSDRRLKHDIHRIGETDEGLPIYKFKYKGDDKTNIGFMADEVEKIHPEAVGESHGFKTVDYDRAARYAGGLVGNSEGGMVTSMHEKEGFFQGGDIVSPIDLSAILASQKQSYAPFQQGGLYGATSGGLPGGKSPVPAANLPVSHLAVASPIKEQQGETLAGDVHSVANMGADVSKLNQYRQDIMGQKAKAAVPATDNTPAQPAQPATGLEWVKEYFGGNQPQGQYRGGLVHAYADGGDVQPYGQNDPMSDVVKGGEKSPMQLKLLQTHQLPTGGSGSSTLGDAMTLMEAGKTASEAIPAFMAMFAARGGRMGYEDGGSAEGDDVVGAMGPQLPNNPNYYKTRAVEIAKNVGIDPVDFVKLGQGESGFFPHSGDDNSSAGVMQNHIGGASSQFPNGGRGDEFIAKYAPDEIKNGTPEQKIAYLNARETQIPQMQDAAEYIKTNGAQPWTVAKQQGLFGATREADMPAKGGLNAQAAGAQGAQGFQPPEGGTQPKSLGDMLTSENTLIPLLSGLGAMAGSKSRYLGSAILEGIGAGAKSYEDVQQNILNRQLGQPIVQQRNMVNANALSSGLIEYNATRAASGLPPVSLEEYARVSGYKGPLPQGGSAATGQAQPSSGYNYTLPEMNNLIIDRGGVQIPAMSDPAYLRAFIAHNAAIQTPPIKNAVESAQHNLDQINSTQRTQNAAGESINAPGAIGTGQQTALASQRMASSGEFVNQAIAFNKIAPNIKQNLSDLEDIYSQFRSGASGPARQSFQQLMGAIDPQGNYPSLHDADASNYQSALKGAASLMTAQLANMPAGAPKSELEALQRQIANPNMEPAAVHHIISRAKAAVDYQDKMNMGYNPEENNYDVLGYQRKFKSTPENDYEKLVNTTEENMKPGAGMSGTITPETGKIYQDANGNKARWDGSKYIKVQ